MDDVAVLLPVGLGALLLLVDLEKESAELLEITDAAGLGGGESRPPSFAQPRAQRQTLLFRQLAKRLALLFVKKNLDSLGHDIYDNTSCVLYIHTWWTGKTYPSSLLLLIRPGR